MFIAKKKYWWKSDMYSLLLDANAFQNGSLPSDFTDSTGKVSLHNAGSTQIIPNALNGNKTIRFNGSSDYIYGNKTDLQIGDTGMSFFIVSKTNTLAKGVIISKFILGADNSRWWINYYQNLLYSNYCGSADKYTDSISAGSDCLITIVWDRIDNTNKIYYNGTLVASFALTATYLPCTHNLIIGGACGGDGNIPAFSDSLFNGDIYEIRCLQRRVTSEEITKINNELRLKYTLW